jgi:hypothetical protein
MKIYKNKVSDVSRVEFCCSDMSKDVLTGRVCCKPWINSSLEFFIKDHKSSIPIRHCHHCGAKIENIIY